MRSPGFVSPSINDRALHAGRLQRSSILWLVLFAVLPSFAHGQTRADSARADLEILQRADAARTYLADTTRVTIHEFVDFACSTCRGFHTQRADSLKARYVESGDTNFKLHVFVIPRLMRGYHAAEAALCAGALADKAGLEAMQDLLFVNQDGWRRLRDPRPVFETYAGEIGLPMDAFRDCLDRDLMAPLIFADMRLGGRAGVPGTPTFIFVAPGDSTYEHQFYGNQPMTAFEEILSRLR